MGKHAPYHAAQLKRRGFKRVNKRVDEVAGAM